MWQIWLWMAMVRRWQSVNNKKQQEGAQHWLAVKKQLKQCCQNVGYLRVYIYIYSTASPVDNYEREQTINLLAFFFKFTASRTIFGAASAFAQFSFSFHCHYRVMRVKWKNNKNQNKIIGYSKAQRYETMVWTQPHFILYTYTKHDSKDMFQFCWK